MLEAFGAIASPEFRSLLRRTCIGPAICMRALTAQSFATGAGRRA